MGILGRKNDTFFLWLLHAPATKNVALLAASPSLDVWKMSWKSSAVICLRYWAIKKAGEGMKLKMVEGKLQKKIRNNEE